MKTRYTDGNVDFDERVDEKDDDDGCYDERAFDEENHVTDDVLKMITSLNMYEMLV